MRWAIISSTVLLNEGWIVSIRRKVSLGSANTLESASARQVARKGLPRRSGTSAKNSPEP